jgi:glycosyltransferase involved in cell wall biosynthesis
VLLVAESGDAGGIGRYCVDLATLLRERASLACLCVRPCDGSEPCWLAEQSAARAIPLIQVRMPPRDWRGGLTGLLDVWRRLGRPLVHVNGRRGNLTALVARFVSPGFRYVTTVHGVLGLHDRRNRLYRLIDLAAGFGARAVIAVSQDTRRRLLRSGSPRGRTLVVPNAIAASDLLALRELAERRAPADRAPSTMRVGFLGRLSPEKGTRELLLACHRLRDANTPLTIAIAGDGPDRAWMEVEARAMIESGFIRFAGTVREALSFLGEVDVLLMPSHNEGMPYALLEAMGAGCAVVAFGVGGIPEVIRDDTVGVLVPPLNVDALVAALHELAEDPARVAAIGRAASDMIVAEYRLGERWPRLAQVYGVTDVAATASDQRPHDVRTD